MITISKVDFKQDKNGNTYKRVSSGNRIANVFPKDPLYSLCLSGAELDAEFAHDGTGRDGRPFFKLQRTDTGATVRYQQEKNPYDEAREKKEDGIQLAQMRKDDSIKQSSTFRDATLLVVALMGQGGEERWAEDKMKEKWLSLRTWLVDHWESHPGDGIPF